MNLRPKWQCPDCGRKTQVNHFDCPCGFERLQQDIRARADGKFVVYRKMPVIWGVGSNRGRSLGYETYDWVSVGVFSSRDAAIVACNTFFLANNARAPSWAGDGFGASEATEA